MDESDKRELAVALLESAESAVRAKRRMAEALDAKRVRRLLSSGVHVLLLEKTEQELAESLVPLFQKQIDSIVGRLESGGKDAKELDEASVDSLDSKSAREASRMIRRAFDPSEWRDDLVNRALPVMAVGMARAVAGQLRAMGVRLPKVKRKTKSVESDLSRKAKSTASRWLDEHPDDLDALDELVESAGVPGFSVLTEMPERMKRRIAEALDRTFSEDYWDEISKTTGGDAERILRMGLDEGWSIRRMVQEMKESLGGDRYARTRATNIARTESGFVLNDARRQEMDDLIADVGDKLKMRQVWLSVLGTTTRPEHADLDGVPADENGQWDLAGYKVSCPGDPVLPPEQRCMCQCSLTIEYGMDDAEARPLIQDYYDRQAAGEEEGKGYDPSQPRVPAGQPGGGQFGSGGGGDSGGSSSGLEGGLSSAASEIRGLSKERVVVLNPDGSRHFSVDGTRDSIFISSEQQASLEGKVTIHNHPDMGMPFSKIDVYNAIVNGELESHVIGPNEESYKISWRSFQGKSKEERVKMANKVKRDYAKVEKEVSAQVFAWCQKNDVKPFGKNGRASAKATVHNTWLTLAKKHGFEYSGNTNSKFTKD